MTLGCHLALDRTPKAYGEEDGANNDVEAMEARGHEEGRTEHPALDGEIGMMILKRLANGEAHTQSDCEREANDQILTVVHKQSVMCPCHRCARKQKDHGH